jgi:hypothetical protein
MLAAEHAHTDAAVAAIAMASCLFGFTVIARTRRPVRSSDSESGYRAGYSRSGHGGMEGTLAPGPMQSQSHSLADSAFARAGV